MKMNKDCVFCRIVRGELRTDKVDESNNFVAFKDAKPRVEGHTLVVSKKHYVTLLDIPDKLGSEMLEFIKNVADRLLDEKLGNGFNLLMNNLESAGQVVMHAHIHVVPRREGDGLMTLG